MTSQVIAGKLQLEASQMERDFDGELPHRRYGIVIARRARILSPLIRGDSHRRDQLAAKTGIRSLINHRSPLPSSSSPRIRPIA